MSEGDSEPSGETRVGSLLREVRTRSRCDLAEVAEALNIRPVFLENIEATRLDLLPAPVYAIGFVRAYAEHLGLDPDEIVRRFKAELTVRNETPLKFPLPLPESGTPRAGVLFIGAVIAIAAYAGWYLSSSHRDVAHVVPPVPDRLERLLSGEPQPAGLENSPASNGASAPAALTSSPPARQPLAPSPGISASPPSPMTASPGPGTSGPPSDRPAPAVPAVLPADVASAPKQKAELPDPSSPGGPGIPPLFGADATAGGEASGGDLIGGLTRTQPASTPQPRVDALAAEPPAGASIDAGGRIVLRARADTWVEVRDSESAAVLAARLLKAGEVLHVPDRPGLRMVTGTAGGLIVIVDGQPAPALGKDGAVRRGIPLDPEVLRRGLDGPAPQ